MKKFVSFLTAAALAISMTAFAANNPLYLHDYEKKNTVNPDPPKVLSHSIPNFADAFTYSFASQDIQYSDFDITFSTADSHIVIYYRSDSGKHTLTLNIERIGSQKSKHVCDREIEVTEDWNRLLIDRNLIKEIFPYYGGLFYISLTDAKSKGTEIPSGEMIVTGTVGFGKEAVVNRGDFAIELAEVLEKDINTEETEPFSDVGVYNYPYEAVMKLRELGIVKGMGDNVYCPKADITYEQALNMAARLFASEEKIEAKGGYPEGGIAVCEEKGLSNGMTEKTSENITVTNQFILMRNIKAVQNEMRSY